MSGKWVFVEDPPMTPIGAIAVGLLVGGFVFWNAIRNFFETIFGAVYDFFCWFGLYGSYTGLKQVVAFYYYYVVIKPLYFIFVFPWRLIFIGELTSYGVVDFVLSLLGNGILIFAAIYAVYGLSILINMISGENDWQMPVIGFACILMPVLIPIVIVVIVVARLSR